MSFYFFSMNHNIKMHLKEVNLKLFNFPESVTLQNNLNKSPTHNKKKHQLKYIDQETTKGILFKN